MGALYHGLLLHWDMILPATFIDDPTGGGTWSSNSGRSRRFDYVAVSRCVQPFIASAGVDLSVHLDINLRHDHLVTGAILNFEPQEWEEEKRVSPQFT